MFGALLGNAIFAVLQMLIAHPGSMNQRLAMQDVV